MSLPLLLDQTPTHGVITIRLELPASVPLSEHEAREILVLKLVEDGISVPIGGGAVAGH
jgi:hypothetical protein